MLTSFSSAEKDCILCWLFLRLVSSLETDADNSPQSLTAVQLIGTMHGLVKPYFQLLTDNTKKTSKNLVFKT